jgi:hypothetical protein
MFYFHPLAPAAHGGLEENFGPGVCSPSRTYPFCQFSIPRDGLTSLQQEIAEMASLFQDLGDGWPVGTNNPGAGAFWVEPPGPAPVFAPLSAPSTFGVAPIDEPIQLTGTQLLDGFRRWAMIAPPGGIPTTRFTKDRVFQSMSAEMRSVGFSDAQICQAYSLHTNALTCPADWL